MKEWTLIAISPYVVYVLIESYLPFSFPHFFSTNAIVGSFPCHGIAKDRNSEQIPQRTPHKHAQSFKKEGEDLKNESSKLEASGAISSKPETCNI